MKQRASTKSPTCLHIMGPTHGITLSFYRQTSFLPLWKGTYSTCSNINNRILMMKYWFNLIDRPQRHHSHLHRWHAQILAQAHPTQCFTFTSINWYSQLKTHPVINAWFQGALHLKTYTYCRDESIETWRLRTRVVPHTTSIFLLPSPLN